MGKHLPTPVFSATLITLMFLYITSTSQATSFASLSKNMNATVTIDESHIEAELLMDLGMGRMLFNYRYLINRAGIRRRPIVTCNRGNAYASCLPAKNQRIRSERCGIYKRRGCF
ncbi:hypothetical protein CXB51_017489 [Gossypium anomalum]|uniref:Uncharacterized protein n=1 Tax=Gossypium anomalum TaxID=47600 RepID=A0A8J5Z1D3_9ROSI|nr:hypothetical protein CXB51_017489 [Gossypium anomalum]